MRDINRIDTFCTELAKLWKDNFPDWRFGQFIMNVVNIIGDPFYLEEDQMLEKIKDCIKEWKGDE